MTTSGRYSQHARRAMMYARLLARDGRHSAVDTSHLLVGILRTEGSLGHRVLTDLNMDPLAAERQVAALHPQRDEAPNTTQIPMSQALRATLALAVEESQLLGHHYIGTEHLLLGLARGGGGAAQALLHEHAISLDQLRRQVRRVMQAGQTEIGLERAVRMARLSELSRRVLNRAALIAQEMDHAQVDLMHLVLALAREGRSPAGQALRACGLDEEELARATLRRRRLRAVGELEDVLDEAVLYAERSGSHYTGTDHIVVTLATDWRGARLLSMYGVDVRQLRERAEGLMRPPRRR